MKTLIKDLYSSDNDIAYKALKELETKALNSKEVYDYFAEFLNMLNVDKSYVRIRGFRLICRLAKWDLDSKINKNIDVVLKILDDNKGIIVRETLKHIHLLLSFKPELSIVIEEKMKMLDLSKYGKSIKPLIEKDISDILNSIATI